jgi:hypothetical protein
MEAGRVLDSGGVDDVLARQPLFRAMWAKAPTATSYNWAYHSDKIIG